MTNEKLFEAIGDIKEEHILEAKQPKEKNPFSWVKVYAIAACLCLVLGIASFSVVFMDIGNSNGGCAYGDPDTQLLEPHRDDFTSETNPAILAQFKSPEKVLKTYTLLNNHWFLSDDLEDFSQVITDNPRYVYPCNADGNDSDSAYSHYLINENGLIDHIGTTHHTNDTTCPYGLWQLTHEKIEEDLAGIEYEDYIITESQRLASVFVWVRTSSEDLILTYPMRPDWMDLENGGIYTLEELQEILKEADNR